MEKRVTLAIGALLVSVAANARIAPAATESRAQRLSILRAAVQGGKLEVIRGTDHGIRIAQQPPSWSHDGEWHKDTHDKSPA
jgi:hypothetical protein